MTGRHHVPAARPGSLQYDLERRPGGPEARRPGGPWFPSGADEEQWGTVGRERTVLAIARTLTSTSRLLEALQYFRGDFRVNVLFTVDATSPFSSSAYDVLRAAGIRRIVPWSEVPSVAHDLAISASENIDFTASKATTVVLPHGIGFNKYVPVPGSTDVRLAGLPPEDALRTGRVRLVLSHPGQDAQLRAVAPEISGHTWVTGDPTFDQLLASRPLAARYRRLFGTGDRRLVLLSSTWRSESQLGRRHELPEQLLRALPADEYQVAMVLHPNVWDWYNANQIRTWLANALDAGLLLIDPGRGWQAALLAADQVIGDHGSVTLYAAALGKPVQLAAFGAEVVANTPVAELGLAADHLTSKLDLREQVDAAVETHDPQRFQEITARTFAYVGESARRLRDALYAELGLTPPDEEPAISRVVDPVFDLQQVTAFDTYTELASPTTVTIHRYPRAARTRTQQPDGHRHLAVDEEERDLRLPQNASVLTRRTIAPDAAHWVTGALSRYPGCRLTAAATPDGCVVGVRDGRRLTVTASDGIDLMLLASTVYACVRARRLPDGEVVIRAGQLEAAITLRFDP